MESSSSSFNYKQEKARFVDDFVRHSFQQEKLVQPTLLEVQQRYQQLTANLPYFKSQDDFKPHYGLVEVANSDLSTTFKLGTTLIN